MLVCVVIFIFAVDFVNAITRNKDCIRKDSNNKDVYVCCAHYFEYNGACKECPIGTISNANSSCIACKKPFYGILCLNICNCGDNESCHHELGCITFETTDGPTTYINYANEGINSRSDKMTILSISVAVFSFVVVLIMAFAKWYTGFAIRNHVITAITRNNKKASCDRKTNIYRNNNKKTLDDDDVYVFDSDNYEQEDQYATIRDSKVLPYADDTNI